MTHKIRSIVGRALLYLAGAICPEEVRRLTSNCLGELAKASKDRERLEWQVNELSEQLDDANRRISKAADALK